MKILDNGTRQNVPDMLIQIGELEVLVECKTSIKTPPIIKKEEAWAVMQKSTDFDPTMKRVTLGKPHFDETSIKKVAASSELTLIEHHTFIEGLLRVLTGSLKPDDFLVWISEPGLADIDRLGGTPTFATR